MVAGTRLISIFFPVWAKLRMTWKSSLGLVATSWLYSGLCMGLIQEWNAYRPTSFYFDSPFERPQDSWMGMGVLAVSMWMKFAPISLSVLFYVVSAAKLLHTQLKRRTLATAAVTPAPTTIPSSVLMYIYCPLSVFRPELF